MLGKKVPALLCIYVCPLTVLVTWCPACLLTTCCNAPAQDPSYLALVQLYASDLKALELAFGHAWYKLMTRDMGPVTRCLGSKVSGDGWGLQHVCGLAHACLVA